MVGCLAASLTSTHNPLGQPKCLQTLTRVPQRAKQPLARGGAQGLFSHETEKSRGAPPLIPGTDAGTPQPTGWRCPSLAEETPGALRG